jgi:hypothetical protein
MQTQSATPTLPPLPHHPHSHKPSSQLDGRMRKVIRDSLQSSTQRAKRQEEARLFVSEITGLAFRG